MEATALHTGLRHLRGRITDVDTPKMPPPRNGKMSSAQGLGCSGNPGAKATPIVRLQHAGAANRRYITRIAGHAGNFTTRWRRWARMWW